jgi:hypothetical protein
MFSGVKTTGHLIDGRLRRFTANEDVFVFPKFLHVPPETVRQTEARPA